MTVSDGLAVLSTIMLSENDIDMMSHRPPGEVASQAAEFIGHVDVLRGELDEDGRRRGEVRLTICHEGATVEAWAYLSAGQYESAVLAHMRGQQVVIRGVLSRGPRLSSLKEIVSFAPLVQA
jgi:hypothetical protein